MGLSQVNIEGENVPVHRLEITVVHNHYAISIYSNKGSNVGRNGSG